jgi:hypothetical protein
VIGFVPWQAPAWQLEDCVHLSPSSHVAPVAFGLGAHLPVATTQAPTLQASFSAEQSTGVPGWHCSVCKLHVSAPLQALPSLQSALVVHGQADLSLVQPPSFSEQVSTEQATPSSQATFWPPHLPPVHASGVVQVKPSLQVVPSGLAGLLHEPVLMSQLPAEWQLSCAEHVTWLLGVQVPFWQASPVLHGLVSSHFTPFCLVGLEHTPVAELHTPASWHWSLAVQVTCPAPTHSPALQESVTVQALASLQKLPFFFSGFEQAPVTLSQVPAS